jgi:hypothetical protein
MQTRRAQRPPVLRPGAPALRGAYLSVASALALALAGSAGALAATQLRGKTYEGSVPSSGIAEGHRLSTHATGRILLRVSAGGRSVTVRFSSSVPLLYCHSQERLHVQSTKPAAISRNGTFTARVDQRFRAGPGPSAIVQVVKGRFSGHTAKGTIQTQAGEYCGGTSSFSATAR